MIKQIMNDPSANRKNPSGSWDSVEPGKVDYYPWLRLGQRHLFPGPPESLEPDRFSCCPRDQSIFV